ncbi:MAG: 30S ribosome-binding factor RbfA [Chloroflexi bacterium]|nr:30S ribosome-binding factor RbfA [Chloroflexota bacterium]MBI3040867.1 30S ribosome-binding factor RbfA [Chloroflexota bacterium]MBI3930753.1 30S ribosome-binding factor RbfA [Chloroflexota bacterium]
MAHRIERVNSLIRQEICQLLQRQVKDPRLGNFITVTEVVTSPDLKYARVFISRIGSEEEKQETLSALDSASGFFRRELAKHLKLRNVPLLSFQRDDSIERGDHLLKLIDEIGSEKDHLETTFSKENEGG